MNPQLPPQVPTGLPPVPTGMNFSNTAFSPNSLTMSHNSPTVPITVDPNNLAHAIAYNESRGVKNPYSFSQSSGDPNQGKALGKYQVTSTELKTYAKRFLGQNVTPEQFLKNPQLQDQYIQGKIKNLAFRGLSPEQILAVHNKGMSDMTPQGLQNIITKAGSYVKNGMQQYQARPPITPLSAQA